MPSHVDPVGTWQGWERWPIPVTSPFSCRLFADAGGHMLDSRQLPDTLLPAAPYASAVLPGTYTFTRAY